MNAKQSLRELREAYEKLQDFSMRSVVTVRRLYTVLDDLITGKNVCENCIDFQECQLQAKETGKGCEDFALLDISPEEVKNYIADWDWDAMTPKCGGDADEITGIHGAGAEG